MTNSIAASHSQQTPLLSVRDLRVALQTAHGHVDALRGVGFVMQRGETLGLIGESGCGKSLTALAMPWFKWALGKWVPWWLAMPWVM